MFSHLHARRKGTGIGTPTNKRVVADPELGNTHQSAALFIPPPPLCPPSHGKKAVSSTSSSLRAGFRQLWRLLSKREVQFAGGSVTSFLLLGLFLGYLVLHHRHRRVIYHVLRDPIGHTHHLFHGRVGFAHHFFTGSPRYVTVVLPSVVRPGQRSARLQGLLETWAPAARGLVVVHNATTEFPAAAHAVWSASGSTPADKYAYPQLLEIPSHIQPTEGWERLKYTIRTVRQTVNPDFAFFVNDHTFVIPPHVCEYLEHRDPKMDLYAGRTLANAEKLLFNSGAAGYLLSRHTMDRLLDAWDNHHGKCDIDSKNKNKHKVKWYNENPGLVTAQCLAALNITPVDTRADQAHRFHAFPLTRVVAGNVDDWYRQKHRNVVESEVGNSIFGPNYASLAVGPGCCATDTLSFHYVNPAEASALLAVRQALLQHATMSDEALTTLLHAEWPHTADSLGAYSRGLPPNDDTAAWRDLLATLRKISTRSTQRDC